jgi:hypothetical protein
MWDVVNKEPVVEIGDEVVEASFIVNKEFQSEVLKEVLARSFEFSDLSYVVMDFKSGNKVRTGSKGDRERQC